MHSLPAVPSLLPPAPFILSRASIKPMSDAFTRVMPSITHANASKTRATQLTRPQSSSPFAHTGVSMTSVMDAFASASLLTCLQLLRISHFANSGRINHRTGRGRGWGVAPHKSHALTSQLPAASYRLPATGYRLPYSSCSRSFAITEKSSSVVISPLISPCVAISRSSRRIIFPDSRLRQLAP